MEMVKLKNGTEEPKAAVIVASISIERLFRTNPVTAYELVMVCRDANHQPFGTTNENLQDLALMDSAGRVHDLVRNVVLSGTRGDDLDIAWSDPIAT